MSEDAGAMKAWAPNGRDVFDWDVVEWPTNGSGLVPAVDPELDGAVDAVCQGGRRGGRATALKKKSAKLQSDRTS